MVADENYRNNKNQINCNTQMKRRIRLTEGDLRRIVKESVRRAINEITGVPDEWRVTDAQGNSQPGRFKNSAYEFMAGAGRHFGGADPHRELSDMEMRLKRNGVEIEENSTTPGDVRVNGMPVNLNDNDSVLKCAQTLGGLRGRLLIQYANMLKRGQNAFSRGMKYGHERDKRRNAEMSQFLKDDSQNIW